MIQLTPQGRTRVESMRGGGAGFATLTQLFDSGGMTFQDLISNQDTTPEKMLAILKVLKRNGYLTVGGARTEAGV